MDEPQLPQHSSVPQFILDTQNSWIVKHQSILERLPDVESFLYSPPGTKYKTPTSQLHHHNASDGPAPTDDELNLPLHLHLEVPADLFNTLIINNHLSHTRRAGWSNAYSRLQELQRCPAAALARVQSLEVVVWVHRDGDLEAEEWQDLRGPVGDKVLDLFASVLTAMTGLERLRWAMLPEFARWIQEGLVSARGLRLPSVSTLEVAPFCEYMVDACLNVEVLKGEGLMVWTKERNIRYAEMLAEAAAKLPKVKEFSVTAIDGLTPSLISTMVKSMPCLVHVRLHGRIPRPRPVRDSDSGEWRPGPGSVRLKDVLAVLAEFSNLEELELPAPTDLRLGVYGRPRCDTQSLLLPAAERAEQNYREHQTGCEQYETVASIVLDILPQLRRLIIDGRQPTIMPSEHGRAIVSWPWSGRFDEYYNEMFRIPKV